MKNLSLASKLSTHLWILASIVIVSTCSTWLLTEKFPLIIGLCIILPLIYIYYIYKIIRRETAILPAMHTIFSEIGNGVFESRLTNIDDATELGELAWQCNNMLDQFEAFYRERTTASAYYREGKYYRKAFSLGLRGNFARLVEDLNVSLENGRKATQEIIRNKEYLQSEIRRITTSLNLLVQNDLTVRIEERSNDEIGTLISYLNSVLSSLDSVIADFQNSALTVTHAVEHMHEHSRDIFSLLQSQEDKITEIAHSTEDMSKVIIENAESISHAALLTTSTTERTQSGKDSVQRTVDGMQQIATMVRTTATMIKDLGKATSQIEIVAQTIEEIADQTNLLALNAAIEAARAGEAGRGFAVVADEVRKLAERTQVSTKEITKTIRDIQTRTNDVVTAAQNGIEQVEQGISLAVQADGMLDGIVGEVNNVKNILTQISVATEELSASSQHIAAATNDLRQNIGSHALQIDSVRTSIETLRGQSDHLDLASSGFKTSGYSSSPVSSQQVKRLYAAQ